MLFLPAAIAASIYLVCAYILVPLLHKHRSRYDQYLPMDTISSTSTTLRDRCMDFVARIALPRRYRVVDGSLGLRRESSDSFGDEEGESMVGFDVNRRDRSVRGGRVEIVTSDGRLSRDLEEGFKDESEDSSGDERNRRGRR